ncbi:hypothetical protein AMTR_s00088p00019910, partial [Amborella trichopoda]
VFKVIGNYCGEFITVHLISLGLQVIILVDSSQKDSISSTLLLHFSGHYFLVKISIKGSSAPIRHDSPLADHEGWIMVVHKKHSHPHADQNLAHLSGPVPCFPPDCHDLEFQDPIEGPHLLVLPSLIGIHSLYLDLISPSSPLIWVLHMLGRAFHLLLSNFAYI